MSINTSKTRVTYLRVKRPRDAPPLSSSVRLSMTVPRIRQQGDDSDINEKLSQLMMNPCILHEERVLNKLEQQAVTKSLVFSRMKGEEGDGFISENHLLFSPPRNAKPVRVLECVYHNNSISEEEERESLPSPRKRRKIQLHLVDSKEIPFKDLFLMHSENNSHANSSSGHVILDPLTRIIDDHLADLFERGTSLSNNGNYLLTLYQNDYLVNTIPSSIERLKRILFHSSAKGGTILHAISFWNNANEFQQLLVALDSIANDNKNSGDIDSSTSKNILSALFSTKNQDSLTPMQLAQMLHNTSIVDAYAHFCEQQDLVDYVYDMFCIMDEHSNQANPTTTTNSSSSDGNQRAQEQFDFSAIPENSEGGSTFQSNDDEISVEIKAGLLGYWNEQGDLVLIHDDNRKGLANNMEEYDHDSNDELYEGNDYPDEEESSSSYYCEEDDDSDSDYYIKTATVRQIRDQQRLVLSHHPRKPGFPPANSNSKDSSSSSCEVDEGSSDEEYYNEYNNIYFGFHPERNGTVDNMLLKDKSSAFAYDDEQVDGAEDDD